MAQTITQFLNVGGKTMIVEIDRGTHTIDGHFWCVDEEGNVVNDVTGEMTLAELSCPYFSGKPTPIYMSAQPEDEERFIQQEMKMIDRNIAVNGAKKYYDYLYGINMNELDCFQNAVLTHHKTGCRIRFGHFGLLKPDGFICWVFGHPDNTFDDFKTPKEITKSAHTRETRASTLNIPRMTELTMERRTLKRKADAERVVSVEEELDTKCAAELATKRAAEIAAELAAEISSVSSSDSSVQSKEEKKKEQTRKANNKRDAKRREQEAFNEQVKAAARAIQEQERLKKEKKFRAQQKKIKEAKAAAEAEEYADMPPLVAPLKVENA